MEPWFLTAFWLILAVVLFVAETATVSLVSIWFAAGALAAFVLSLLHLPFWLQTAAFGVVSLALFWILKGRLQEYFRFRHEDQGAAAILGQSGIVTEAIDPLSGSGRVMIHGQDWKAAANRPLPENTKIKATGLQGVTLQVVEEE